MLGCASWPNVGVVASEVMSTLMMLPMYACQRSMPSNVSASVPSRYFCVLAAKAEAMASLMFVQVLYI